MSYSLFLKQNFISVVFQINLNALLGIAQVYVRTKEYDRALQFYTEILEYYPENAKALNGKYSMLQQIKDIIN
ncbi:unnamed protein product [marine sediment metagenome]|uniref:Uncharacterized protein n=1 Tax=marine sediment metagenome TaxID=412755 RepID=X1IV19_9ZZZZ